ncbi:MAG: hypothetical protein UT81_C0005G0011 [Parcubacteria group bacterium GW2011_GWA2_40_14]|nr:MAG: hypothetical protein UT81_C0005G0011 [Parcubacteria group bacterium GW2011_GWA2_40_14]
MVLLYFIADVERAKSESTLYDFRAEESNMDIITTELKGS